MESATTRPTPTTSEAVPENNGRYSRQEGMLPTETLKALSAMVIGLGAIGRQVALQLTAMGVGGLELLDFDKVEECNLASQGYREEDMGELKVDATQQSCRQMNSGVECFAFGHRFRKSMAVPPVIFCCVDGIETRGMIWKAVKDRIDFFCDGRMAAEVMRILTVQGDGDKEFYATTLFKAEEANPESCTAKTTIYCANIAAGMMVTQLARWLRKFPTDEDLQFNLLASELTVGVIPEDDTNTR